MLVALLAAGGVTVSTSSADAASIGASVGYGTAGGNPNAYGLGFVGRVGYTFPLEIYLGGTFVYHLGSSTENAFVNSSQNVWYAGGELGYVIGTKHFEFRPYVGFGGIVLQTERCALEICTSPTESSWYFGPGVYGQYDIGPIYVGADIRYIAAANNQIQNSFGFFGSLGVNF